MNYGFTCFVFVSHKKIYVILRICIYLHKFSHKFLAMFGPLNFFFSENFKFQVDCRVRINILLLYISTNINVCFLLFLKNLFKDI